MMIFRISACAFVFTLLSLPTASYSTPIPVGTGDNHVMVVVNFSDGAIYEFDVGFEPESTTGLGLLDILETAGIGFSTVRLYGGSFIDTISYDGHSDSGYEAPDGWWHYWFKSFPEDDWHFDWAVDATRTVYDGYSDGWVWGNPNAPIPEPMSAAMLAVGGALLLRRRFFRRSPARGLSGDLPRVNGVGSSEITQRRGERRLW